MAWKCVTTHYSCLMRKLLYGSVAPHSEMCPFCKEEAFVVDGKFTCCKRRTMAQPDRWKRMSAGRTTRYRYGRFFRDELIQTQNGLCFWCLIPFATREYRGAREIQKKIHIEHIEPFIYASCDVPGNLVASCSVCNQIKSCLMFPNIYDARDFIQNRRLLKGYTTKRPKLGLSSLREIFRCKA